MGTSTISMASYSSSQTVTVITRGYYTCRVGESNPSTIKSSRSPISQLGHLQKGVIVSSWKESSHVCWFFTPSNCISANIRPRYPSDRSARWCPSLLGDLVIITSFHLPVKMWISWDFMGFRSPSCFTSLGGHSGLW